MTTVNVVLTPGVDTDQQPSAQAQIAAAPNGTLGNETIINMPVGRFRMDRNLYLNSKSHIRWTCLAGEQVYPNFPTDSQAFIAYTNFSSAALGLSTRIHYQIVNCTNVIGSFLRIDGPNVQRRSANPLYAYWGGLNYNDHGFAIHASTDSGFEDCSWHNVYGDGTYVGGVSTRSVRPHLYRMTGDYAGRMNLGLISCIDAVVIDYTGDWSGFAGTDIEPLGADEWVWDAYLENIHMGSYFYPYTFLGRDTPSNPGKKNITLKNSFVTRCANSGHKLQTGRTAAGYLVIDGFTDLRNSNLIGMTLDGPWDDITVRNATVAFRNVNDTGTSYGVRPQARDRVTLTDNTFNGLVRGFDNLAVLSVVPPDYVHSGNVWNMGASNDGSAPLGGVGAVTAAKPSVAGSGTATNLAVGNVTAAAPSVAGVGSATFVSEVDPLPNTLGPPFRVRGRRPSRIRGAAGATIRGQGGIAEAHPFRVRPETSISRIRSETAPAYLRSGEQGEPVTGVGAVTAAAPSVAGLGASADINGIGNVTAAAPSVAGLAEEQITGIGAVTAAIPTVVGTGTLSDQSTGAVTAEPPSVAGVGAVSATGVGGVTAAAPSVSGSATLEFTGVGSVFAPAPSVAGVGSHPIIGSGAVIAAPPSVHGVGGRDLESWYLPPTVLGFAGPHVSRHLDQLGVPRSPLFRRFYRNLVDSGEVVEGFGFLGGRWNGPLTDEQIAAIEAAGQGGRIVQVLDLTELPAGIEEDFSLV